MLGGCVMRKIIYHSGGDFDPSADPYFTIQCDCFRCGNKTSVAIDKDSDYDRTEAKYWEERYKELVGDLNTKISKLEKQHGFNPINQIFIDELIEIRRKLVEKTDPHPVGKG